MRQFYFIYLGAKLSDIYKSVVSKCRREKPHLVDKLNKSFGFLTGLEFRESTYLINGKNEQRVQTGFYA